MSRGEPPRPPSATHTGVHQDAGRLPRCTGCALPVAACLCAELHPFAVATRVVVRMHRVESTKLTNTGRLVPKLVAGAELEIVGVTAPPEARPREGERRLLLFPSPNALALGPELARGGPVRLVVPDGSWSQARRIAQHELRRPEVELVSLPDPGTSRYRLRRKPVEGGLATLEALAHALGALEGPEVEEHLLRAFDRFVAIHRALRAGEGARLGNELARVRAAEAAARLEPGEAPAGLPGAGGGQAGNPSSASSSAPGPRGALSGLLAPERATR